jgi:16S rRNA (guanine527-N7)-methyltransferase
MSVSADRIKQLVAPYIAEAETPNGLYEKLAAYLELLVKWNARTNLTAIREPEEMVRRHFGESLFVGIALRERLQPKATVLDYGSGAGFPGLPVALLLPEVRVTLAESQGKKASFLREAVRTLGVTAEVWAKRVEEMPNERTFDAVTLRAVDDMSAAMAGSASRIAKGGVRAVLGGTGLLEGAKTRAVPGSSGSFLYLEG